MKKSIFITTILAAAIFFTGCNNQVDKGKAPELLELLWTDDDISTVSDLTKCTNRQKELDSTKTYTMIYQIFDPEGDATILYLSPDKDFKTKQEYICKQEYYTQTSAYKNFKFENITQKNVTYYVKLEDIQDNVSQVYTVDLVFTDKE